MVGFQKSVFYFGYAYQVTTNGLSAYNSGTHVVTIGLNFLQGISNCACVQSAVHKQLRAKLSLNNFNFK